MSDMGDSIWKLHEKNKVFFFKDFWQKQSKVFDVLVIKNIFFQQSFAYF